ncbi:DUF3631 domain-containing protein [Nocardia grenadensis]
MLEEVRAHFAAYVYTADPDDDAVTLALWVAHTYVCEETYTSPRLKFDSPMPGSGKTTALEHIQHLARDPLLMSTVSSPAMIPRILDQEVRTLLIDECDRSLSPKKPGIEDVLAIINSGYKKSSTRPVLIPDKEKGWIVQEMSTYSPVAMAGNAPDLPEDTVSRCIEILCVPANNGEVAETDWELLEPVAAVLAGRLSTAVEQVRSTVTARRPELPAGLTGRRKEVWRPLARVAAAAGGIWPPLLEKIIAKDMERSDMMKEDGARKSRPHVMLLADMRTAFGDEEFVKTAELLDRLTRANPELWGADVFKNRTAITAQRMGRMLSTNYRIHSWRPTSPKNSPRGYRRSDFLRAWQYMGIAIPETSEAPEELEI